MEPPVSDPSAAVQSEAATAAPLPPLDPPGTQFVFHGLRVGGVTFPHANSCMFVLPMRMAPASLSRRTVVASTSGNDTGALLPTVVGMSAVR